MRRLLPNGAINLAAYAFFEPQEPLIPFIPSWYNVWESHMLRLAGKKAQEKVGVFNAMGSIMICIYVKE